MKYTITYHPEQDCLRGDLNGVARITSSDGWTAWRRIQGSPPRAAVEGAFRLFCQELDSLLPFPPD